MKNYLFLLTILFVLAFTVSCEDKIEPPVVSVPEVSNITHNSATIKVAATNGSLSTIKIYSEDKTDFLGEADQVFFKGDSVFAMIAGLDPSTTYIVVAQAFIQGLAGENSISFTTESVSITEDCRDGAVYPFVKIGNQEWLAENINFNLPGSQVYPHEGAQAAKAGRLYTFEQAKEACPCGWRLPTDDDWKELELTIGVPLDSLSYFGKRGNVAGKLKQVGHKAWHSFNGEFLVNSTTNSTGFSAMAGGLYCPECPPDLFSGYDREAYFWTATAYDDEFAIARNLFVRHQAIRRMQTGKGNSYSVRCVKE